MEMTLAEFNKVTPASMSVPSNEQLSKGEAWGKIHIIGSELEEPSIQVIKPTAVVVEELKPEVPTMPQKQEATKQILSNKNKTTKVKPSEEEESWNEVGKKADRKEETKHNVYTQPPKKPANFQSNGNQRVQKPSLKPTPLAMPTKLAMPLPRVALTSAMPLPPEYNFMQN